MQRRIRIALLVICGVLLAAGICFADSQRPSAGGVAIYLLKDAKATLDEITAKNLTELELQAEPLIASSEIVEYNWSAHAFKVSASAFRRIQAFGITQDRSVIAPFVVVVGKEPVYLGTFWSLFSSIMPKVPTIYVPAFSPEFIIQRAAFAPESSPDIRSDSRIHESLSQARILVE
jgi:hypothetical protein